jgi:MFS family permease
MQLAWLAAAVFVVSAGYGALLPLLPGWLTPMMPGATATEVGRHVGFLSGVYAAGVLVGAPLWGFVSDRVGHGRILIVGLVGYVASLLLLLVPGLGGLWGLYVLRGTTGFFVAAVVPVVSALVAEWLTIQPEIEMAYGVLLSVLFGKSGVRHADSANDLTRRPRRLSDQRPQPDVKARK